MCLLGLLLSVWIPLHVRTFSWNSMKDPKLDIFCRIEMESNANVTFSISVSGGPKGAKTDGIEVHLAGYYEGIMDAEDMDSDDMDSDEMVCTISFLLYCLLVR